MAWKRFEVVETPDKGRGLVACRRLQPGQLVMRITGQVIDDPSYSSRYCIDLGRGRSLEPNAPGAFLNHSCNPNCALILGNGNKVELRAKMAINPNQELTIDYAWEAEADPLPCRCGSVKCRRYIVDATELPKILASLASPN